MRLPPQFVSRLVFLVVVCCLALPSPVAGQVAPGPDQGEAKPDPDPAKTAQGQGLTNKTIDALRELQQRIAAKIEERDKIATELNDAKAAQDEALRSKKALELAAAESSLATLKRQFASVASEVDLDAYEKNKSKQFDLNAELVRVLRPLVEELKDATEAPREIEQLRSDLEIERRAREVAEAAVRTVEAKLSDDVHQSWHPQLREVLKGWQERLNDIRSREAVLQQQLAQREAKRRSFLDSSTQFLRDFFGSRGMNLALGLLAMLGVFLLLRMVRSVAIKQRILRSPKRLSFASRLVDLLFGILVAIFAVSSMLLVFYAADDWLLLVATMLIIFGIGWGSLRALPKVFEQTRMLLNLGSVREGERIVRNGIPWRVDRLRVYTLLINPKLAGGMLRLPVKDLVGLHSRPVASGEVWFPTSRGDWVVLSDGLRVEVISQTPDFVQLRELGGAMHTCRTEDFLGMKPRNLSQDFRIPLTFGVDYAHQAICTTEIPGIMETRLQDEIKGIVADGQLVSLRVEFKEAGPSSLDYQVLADFTGDAARDHDRIKRAMGRILVDVCNERGWTIPFTQVTIHQA